MESEGLKIASVAKDLRLCVIENSIFVEELASRILGDILNVDWKNSKSFGHTSASLTFNQKLQLIQDIKGIHKEDLKKLICLANIRNKFAHVSHIDSFEKLFNSSGVGKDVKTNFLNWFFDKNGYSDIHSSKIEFINRLCFYLLVNDVVEILLKISGSHYYNLGVADGKKEFAERFLSVLVKSLVSKKQQFIVLEAIEEAEKLMKNEELL